MELYNRPKVTALLEVGDAPFGADYGDLESWWHRTLRRYVTFENGRQMQPDDIWVSIVVDTVDDHLYKADRSSGPWISMRASPRAKSLSTM